VSDNVRFYNNCGVVKGIFVATLAELDQRADLPPPFFIPVPRDNLSQLPNNKPPLARVGPLVYHIGQLAVFLAGASSTLAQQWAICYQSAMVDAHVKAITEKLMDSIILTGHDTKPLICIDAVCMPWNSYDVGLIAFYPPRIPQCPRPFDQVLSRLTREVKADGF